MVSASITKGLGQRLSDAICTVSCVLAPGQSSRHCVETGTAAFRAPTAPGAEEETEIRAGRRLQFYFLLLTRLIAREQIQGSPFQWL